MSSGSSPDAWPPPPRPGFGPDWHRLHPLSPIVRTGRHVFALAILVVLLVAQSQGAHRGDVIVDAAVIGVALVANVVSWLVTRWQVADGVLRIETGLVRRQSRRFPLSQVQAIDVVQTGVARVFGLAELRLRMAASGGREGRLACLTLAHAEQLRLQLLALGRAAQAAPEPVASSPSTAELPAPLPAPLRWSPDGAAPVAVVPGAEPFPAADEPAAERVLFEVAPGTLAASIVLTKFGVAALVSIVLLVGVALAHVAGLAGVAVVWLFSVVVRLWRRYNGSYGTVVTDTPAGLRIQSGMVQTTTETIRTGRVQAVILVEPLVWRLLGWCRIEVDVAGPRQRRENAAEAGRQRAVMPVGTREQGERLLDELAPGRPLPARRPPPAARWKAPLSYHFLGWDADGAYITASRGRLCRTTTWVPLAKVQSVRSVQGPWQRALGLGTVMVDTAGRRVHATLRDRSVDEVSAAMASLPVLARAARSEAPASPGPRA